MMKELYDISVLFKIFKRFEKVVLTWKNWEKWAKMGKNGGKWLPQNPQLYTTQVNCECPIAGQRINRNLVLTIRKESMNI